MENENDQAQVSNEQEEVTLEVTEETADNSQNETVEESVEDLKARLAKAEETARNQKIRAEKAEKLAKPQAPAKPEAPKVNMSTRDYIALVNAKINEEDITEVEEYARFKNVSIADALKSSVVKTLIAEKEEMRKTANAANVNNVRRGASKISDDVLLAKASKGEMLDDVDALAKARFEARKNKK
jgi:hypothetical protein